MIFKKWSLAAIATVLVAPLSASALGISINSVSTSGGTSYLEDGDSITFNLLLENATNEDVFGLGLGATGYDEGAVGAADNHLLYSSGSNSSSVSPRAVAAATFAWCASQPSSSERSKTFPVAAHTRSWRRW